MEYEGQICRPPMERSSYMLPVAVGCSYNRCTFCTLFKHLRYRPLPIEQVEQELKRVSAAGGNPVQIFLGDGNAFGMETDHLLHILELIHCYFPGCRMVNMDATVTNISQKSDKELRLLYDQGVRRLYLGIESGLDDVLSFTKKDHNLQQAYCQIERMKNAGMIFNAHIMTGIAGAGRGTENAQQTALFFNRTQPERIINFSLFLNRRAKGRNSFVSVVQGRTLYSRQRTGKSDGGPSAGFPASGPRSALRWNARYAQGPCARNPAAGPRKDAEKI